MRSNYIASLVIVFALVLSFTALPGPLAALTHFPSIPAVKASPAPATNWLPAGPSTNTQIQAIFASDIAEQTALLAETIDLSDVALTPPQVTCLSQTGTSCSGIPGVNPSHFSVTSPLLTHDIFEIQIELHNNYWGIPFNYGLDTGCSTATATGAGVNDATCPGVSIRQAVAHLVDKSRFCSLNGVVVCSPVDNDVSVGLVTADPCGWDALFPQTGANCIVGAPGGTAYHLGSITGVGHDTTGVAATFGWEPAVDNGGQADLCAAAQHLVTAGVATGFSPTTCVLTGISAGASAHPVNVFARSDRPARLALGDGLTQDLCYLFTGKWSDATCQQIPTTTTACSGTCVVTETRGTFSAFPGFTTCANTNCGGINDNWWLYTGGFGGVFPFDTLLFGQHNSQFVSGGVWDQPACSTLAVSSTGATNYQYTCVRPYDNLSSQLEFSTCQGGATDPSPPQTRTTVTFAACSATTPFTLSSSVNLPSLPRGSQDSTIEVTRVSPSFSGVVSLSSSLTSSPAGSTPPTILLDGASTTSADLTTSAARQVTVTNVVSTAVTAGTYQWTITGASGSVTVTILVTDIVTSTTWTYQIIQKTLTASSAGYLTEDLYGKLELWVPIYVPSEQFGYLASWNSVINNQGSGIPNPFTWLNAYKTGLTTTSVIQALAAPTKSLNPYSATTVFDFETIGNIYDSIGTLNPVNNGQYFDYLASGHSTPCNTAVGTPCDLAHLGYTPSAATIATLRFTLRPDVFWQSDSVGITHPAQPLTAWDISFTYRTLKDTGSFQGGVLAAMEDVHVLDRSTFDINLNAIGPFTLLTITGPTILPGRYWSATCSGATWDADVAAGSVPDMCRIVTSQMSTITFDPLSSTPNNGISPGILIGSSLLECQSSAGIVGSGCSSTGTQNPPGGGSYTLTRFGCNRASSTCNAPGTNPTSTYFRSAGTLALAIWAGTNADSNHDTVMVGSVAFCFNRPVGQLGCTQWQRGIGNPGSGTSVNVLQVTVVIRFSQDGNWVAPFNWLPGIPSSCCPFTSSPPTAIQSPTPVLFEGAATLSPCSIDSVNGYDC